MLVSTVDHRPDRYASSDPLNTAAYCFYYKNLPYLQGRVGIPVGTATRSGTGRDHMTSSLVETPLSSLHT